MKKLLSSAMAVSMVATMSTVAFAADATSIKVDTGSKLYKESDGILYEVAGDIRLTPGQKLYVEVLPENPGEEITNKLAGQYKVVADWSNGKEVYEKSAIESKKASEATGKYNLINGQTAPHGLLASYNVLADLQAAIDAVIVHDPSCNVQGCVDPTHDLPLTADEKTEVLAKYAAEKVNTYKYVAAIYTKSSYTTKQADLIGSVKVVKKSTSNTSSAPSVNINSVVGHPVADIGGDMHEVDNDTPVISFEDIDGEVELLFGNIASFTVNGKNQSDLFLGYTEKPNTDVIDKNPTANIDFVSFKANPAFNRIGTMRLFADEDMFIYEVTSDGLKTVKTTYDEDYGAYAFETRALTSYAISDKELEYTADAPSEEKPTAPTPDSGNTTKPNPDTGVGNVAGAVAAMGILSLVSAGAIALKKSK